MWNGGTGRWGLLVGQINYSQQAAGVTRPEQSVTRDQAIKAARNHRDPDECASRNQAIQKLTRGIIPVQIRNRGNMLRHGEAALSQTCHLCG